MENKEISFAVSVGQLLLRSGAEIRRVEDTMNRIMLCSNNCINAQSYVTPTLVMATFEDTNNNNITLIERNNIEEINLSLISEINDLSRKYVEGKCTLDEATNKLLVIKSTPTYPIAIKVVFGGISALGFSLLVGLRIDEVISAFFVGIVTHIFLYYIAQKKFKSAFLQIMSTSVIIGVLSILFSTFRPHMNINAVIIGSIMPFVPGIAMINAGLEIVEGNYVSATARSLSAFSTTVAIAVGIGITLTIWSNLFGGVI